MGTKNESINSFTNRVSDMFELEDRLGIYGIRNIQWYNMHHGRAKRCCGHSNELG
ncbi:MAG: hypothetical protein V3V00_05665 [Saprospiraceae bacterium]